MMEFLAMGGYAVFIWPAWVLAFILLAAITASSFHDLRQQQKLLVQLEATKS